MTDSTNNIGADISTNGQLFEELTSFKCPGASFLQKNGTCSAEVRIRIASAMAAMTRINRIWRCNTISFASRFKPHESLVTSILIYGCEAWTLLADSEKKDPGLRNHAPEKTSLHLLFEHKTNDWMQSELNFIVGPRDLFWQLSRDGNLHGSGMSHATTPSPKSSFRAPWSG